MKHVRYLQSIAMYRHSFIDNELYISGEFNYRFHDIIPCYTKDGEYIRDIEINEGYETVRNQTKKVDYTSGNVVQLGYEFKVMPWECVIRRQDEVHKFVDAFNRSDLGYKLQSKYIEDFAFIRKESTEKYLELDEVVLLSTSTQACRNVGKGILDFDYNQYLSNLNAFIKETESEYLQNQAKYLFHQNIKIITTYFDCTEEQLKKGDFFKLIEKRMKRTISRTISKKLSKIPTNN